MRLIRVVFSDATAAVVNIGAIEKMVPVGSLARETSDTKDGLERLGFVVNVQIDQDGAVILVDFHNGQIAVA